MDVIEVLGVLLLGGLVAGSELASRYRDEPARAVFSWPGLLYLAVNALAAVGALAFIYVFDWRFGVDANDTSILSVTRVLAAGIGSAAIFRTSLFTVRLGEQDIGIGPSALLTAILKATDSAIDRKRAVARLDADLMRGVSFKKHHAALTELCTYAMQNLDLQDAQRLGTLSSTLSSTTDISDRLKAEIFGLELMTLVGRDAVASAVRKVLTLEASRASKPAGIPFFLSTTPTSPSASASGAPLGGSPPPH